MKDRHKMSYKWQQGMSSAPLSGILKVNTADQCQTSSIDLAHSFQKPNNALMPLTIGKFLFKKCTIPQMLQGFPQEHSGGWPLGKPMMSDVTIIGSANTAGQLCDIVMITSCWKSAGNCWKPSWARLNNSTAYPSISYVRQTFYSRPMAGMCRPSFRVFTGNMFKELQSVLDDTGVD